MITPSVAIKNGGVSNFGNHIITVVPYTLSFLLEAMFIYLAAEKITKMNEAAINLVRVLRGLSILILIVLISTFPRHFSFTFSDIHDYLGIALFSYQLIFSIWMVANNANLRSWAFLLTQISGSVVGLLSITKVIHFLFIGQFVGSLGFALSLCLIFPVILQSKYFKIQKT